MLPGRLPIPQIRSSLEFFLAALISAKVRTVQTQQNREDEFSITAKIKALDKLVIADCPVVRFGWVKSRIHEHRYVRRREETSYLDFNSVNSALDEGYDDSDSDELAEFFNT